MKKVLVGGSFDMLHPGHLDLIKTAKSYGDYLVVMLTSDERIKFKKHNALPIYCENDRVKIIRSLKWVDEAVVIKEDPDKNIAMKALKIIRPDVYVRTNEVNKQTLEEEIGICRELNIEVVLLNRLPGSKYRSSSRIIDYIVSNFQSEKINKLIKKDETE